MGAKESRILVIEDDEGIRETLQLALELEGHRVITAANGKEGLELLMKSPRPCVIILDLMMPVMNGWKFSEELNRNPAWADIPLIVVTAFGEQAKAIHANEVFEKPVDLPALFRSVENWCGTHG